jgi:hypothetical protein
VAAEFRNHFSLRYALVIGLALVAGALLATLGRDLLDQPASAQVTTSASQGRGVTVMAGQISDETYGLYLVDEGNKTICVYQLVSKDRRLKLVAARYYGFDVQLDDYGNEDPRPREVKDLVERHRRLGNN